MRSRRRKRAVGLLVLLWTVLAAVQAKGCVGKPPRSMVPRSIAMHITKRASDAFLIPARYDGREHGRTAPVKDQGELGTCWAFASLLAMENSMRPEEEMDFSEDHMSHDENFALEQADGGAYIMSMAYLLGWRGPVLEAQDPYGDGESPKGLLPAKHVQEIRLLPSGDLERIKRAVLEYGGVQSSLYTTFGSRSGRREYEKQETSAYYYPYAAEPNHDVVIVGWDDDFPKESFSVPAPENGAFLCENSWGTRFGEDGFFYVSYYDANLGKVNVCYSSIEETDNYDFIYQSDLCGWTGQMGYGTETSWAANVYTAKKRERLEAVGFYAVDRETDYEVYIVPTGNMSDSSSDFGQAALENRRLAAAGHLEDCGYYTIALDRAEILEAGEKFAVIVKLTTPEAEQPIAVEYDTGDGKTRVTLDDGEGYISSDGVEWERTETEYRCNVCLKAYSSEIG